MKKNFIILLFILFLSPSLTAQESDIKEELAGKIEEKSAQEKFNVHDFRDPFQTWLPKAILQKAEERIQDIAIITQEKQGLDESIPQEEITPPTFTIQGLIWNTDSPQAIVNDTIVKIGDTVNEAKILNIAKEGITVIYRNKEFLIKPQLSIIGSDQNIYQDRRF